MVSVMKFLRRNALACLLEDTSLLRLLRLAMVGLQIMKYFSHRDKLHLLEALLQGLACFKILHFMLKLTLSSFNFHTCLLNSVQCFLLGFLKEVILLNLVLKVLAVSPTQLGLVWPIIGRNGGLVHYRFGEALVFLDSMVLLCPSMACLMLLIQLQLILMV